MTPMSQRFVLSLDTDPVAEGWPVFGALELVLPSIMQAGMAEPNTAKAILDMLKLIVPPGCGVMEATMPGYFHPTPGQMVFAIGQAQVMKAQRVCALTLLRMAQPNDPNPKEMDIVGSTVLQDHGPVMHFWPRSAPHLSIALGYFESLSESADQGRPLTESHGLRNERISIIMPAGRLAYPGVSKFFESKYVAAADFEYHDNPLSVLRFFLARGRQAMMLSPGEAQTEWLAPVVGFARKLGYTFWYIKPDGTLERWAPLIQGVIHRLDRPALIVHGLHAPALLRPCTE